jgi:Cu/Ag efflux protein CusF
MAKSPLLIAAALAAALSFPAAAFAAEDDGLITAIDREALTITLDNGNTYKLPGEINLEGIEEGMEIVLAYEDVDGERQVTDMALFE